MEERDYLWQSSNARIRRLNRW